MLEDRPYMRQPSFGRPHYSATIMLLILNLAAFLVENLLPARVVYEYLALSNYGLVHGWVWQLITFQFLHAGIWHLLGNCVAIYFLGQPVEEALGPKRFWTLYFCSGIFGGLCQMAAGFLFGGPFGASVMGASAGAFGLTAAYALLFPESILLLFFVIPIKAKYLLWLCAVVAIGGVAAPNSNFFGAHVAHTAHLGGMVFGIFFVRYGMHWKPSWPRFRSRRATGPTRRLVRVHSKGAGWKSSVSAEDVSPDEFLSKEVDPILDKISAQGIQSLTERERRILEAARKRMRK